MDIQQFKQVLFDRGAALGFTDMEIFYQSKEKFDLNVFQGELDQFTVSVDGGLAFRGLIGGRMGYAYTEKLDEESISFLLEGARSGAAVTDAADVQPFFAGGANYPDATPFNPALENVQPDAKIALNLALEAECFKADSRVQAVSPCSVATERTERFIANTRGLELRERSNVAVAFPWVIVKDGDEARESYRIKASRDFQALDPAELARGAVGEAVAYLGARSMPSGAYPVLLRNTAAANLLLSLVPAFIADGVQKGRSVLKGKVGQQIAVSALTITDDPLMRDGLCSRSFDAEGVPSRTLNLVENGVLKSFLYNLKTAAIDGVQSTGHGYKPSYKGAIDTAPTNLYIAAGTSTPEAMVESIADGLMVAVLDGLHTGVNPVSGDFSLSARGFRIQGGRLGHPVSQITVAGNFFTMLQEIEAVGTDLTFETPDMVGLVGAPTLKIRSLSVAGE